MRRPCFVVLSFFLSFFPFIRSIWTPYIHQSQRGFFFLYEKYLFVETLHCFLLLFFFSHARLLNPDPFILEFLSFFGFYLSLSLSSIRRNIIRTKIRGGGTYCAARHFFLPLVYFSFAFACFSLLLMYILYSYVCMYADNFCACTESDPAAARGVSRVV